MSDDVEITPDRAAALVSGDDAQLVDVREPHEVAAGRLAGSRHVALGQLTEQAPTLDPERPIVFYCHSGARSRMAADAFRAAGYQAYNLTGGITAWEQRGLPVDGEVAH